MKKREKIIGMVVALILVGTSLVMAYGPGMGMQKGRGIVNYQQGNIALLSPEKRNKLFQMRNRFLEETSKLRSELFNRIEKMRLLMFNPNASDEEVIAAQKALMDVHNQLSQKRLEFRLKLRKEFPNFTLGFGPGIGSWGHGLHMGLGMRGGCGRTLSGISPW